MIVEKSEIAEKLQKMKNVVPSKGDVEQVKGVLFDKGTLHANNLMMGITTQLDTESQETFVIPPKAIDMLMSLPMGEVSITLGANNRLTIEAREIKNSFQTFPAEEFQVFPPVEGGDTGNSLSCKQLQKALASVVYAVATDERKPQMCGVLIRSEDEALNLVGCDGYRIAWANIKSAVTDIDVIVPREAVQKFLQIDEYGPVRIKQNRKSVLFETDAFSISTRILIGDYFNYQKPFPAKESMTHATICRADLVNSINRASICMDKAKSMIFLELQNQTLKVSATSSICDYAETLPVKENIETAVKACFNGRYLIDCLKSYSNEFVEVRFSGAATPAVLEDEDLKSLVLPVRTKE